MNGADTIVLGAAKAGLEIAFINPGTTELTLIRALEQSDALRSVLVLSESVATGAADGYARIAEKPALTVTHLGPSFANGIANVHNARRARSPMINIVGDQPTWHRRFDPPLVMDVEQLARPVSDWVRSVGHARDVARDLAEAVDAAKQAQIATLIVPADCQWDAADGGDAPAAPAWTPPPPVPSADAIDRAVQSLRNGGMLILGAHGTRERGMRAAARIAEATKCRVFVETFPARVDHVGTPRFERVPYVAELAQAVFANAPSVTLAGVDDPVAFFGSQRAPSRLLPEGVVVNVLAHPRDDIAAGLEMLADALHAPRFDERRPPAAERPTGPLNARSLAAAVAAVQPEHAIIVDEGVSAGGAYLALPSCPHHAYLGLTGGATGFGLSCAAGAALAARDRKVILIVGDGSVLFTPQALWTHARLALDVVTIVCANDAYRVLQLEMARRGDGGADSPLFSLADPAVDWAALAKSMGVSSARAASAEALSDALRRALDAGGPHLIEARMA